MELVIEWKQSSLQRVQNALLSSRNTVESNQNRIQIIRNTERYQLMENLLEKYGLQAEGLRKTEIQVISAGLEKELQKQQSDFEESNRLLTALRGKTAGYAADLSAAAVNSTLLGRQNPLGELIALKEKYETDHQLVMADPAVSYQSLITATGDTKHLVDGYETLSDQLLKFGIDLAIVQDSLEKNGLTVKLAEKAAYEKQLKTAKTKIDAAKNKNGDYIKSGIENYFNKEAINNIYSKIDPHPKLTEIGFKPDMSDKIPKLQIMAKSDQEQLNPNLFFSTGQINVLSLSIFLAKACELRSQKISTIFMDDPVQNLSDINVLSFIDLLRTLIMAEDKQIVISTLGKLDHQLEVLSAPAELDSVLLALSTAENEFQQACLHNDAVALAAYKQAISHSLVQVTRIMQRPDEATKDTAGLATALRQKLELSQKLFSLRQGFDSLMNRTTAVSLGLIGDANLRVVPSKPRLKVDTVVSTKNESSKAGLFSRLKDAIRNKTKVKVMTIYEPAGGKPGRLSAAQQVALQQAVRELSRQYGLMGRSGQQLIAANLRMLSDLRQLAEQVRRIETLSRQKLRNDILRQYHETSDAMDRFTSAGLILLLIFTVLLIFYVKRTISAEKDYLSENERAVVLAAQKSEILAIMSHEVRNKLTAINGAVFMLKRSELSPVQLQRVESVGYSSVLLLDTVNNVLDVSKIEYGHADVLKVQPFRPLAALREAVEAMRYSAEKNGLEIVCDLTGDQEQQVSGDALRLKQVVINLMGNAIKFTKAGSVTITGELRSERLKVIVRDTGPGIPEEEQHQLFTRYYQGGKDGHKPGTGLGLYLCRQLVELQDGEINLQSSPGHGCTVSFSIPYQQA